MKRSLTNDINSNIAPSASIMPEIDLKNQPASSSPNSQPKSKNKRYLVYIIIVGIFSYILLFKNAPSTLEKEKLHGSSKTHEITVVINTFQRLDMMQDAIEHYASCDITKYIYIIWSEKELPPERIIKKYANIKNPLITFSPQKIDSLNNRFKPLEGIHTDGIFAVDDDMRVSCSDLELAFEVWRSSPRSLVGFMPRVHLRKENGLLEYRCWWNVWWHGVYSIILTKAAFLHHDFLVQYTNNMSIEIRNLVDNERNCEDIAMQFLIANTTKLPPIYVKGDLDDLGALNGISTQKNVVSAGHMGKRSQCLNDLTKLYGHNPLVSSHFIVNSAADSWVNSPSSWYEYISSDLWKF